MRINEVTASALHCTLTKDSTYGNAKDVVAIAGASGESLNISFERTIRVPDNGDDSKLPPSMGKFPLYSVADYKNTLPAHMTLKGGLFLPMYQREAMWIRFESQHIFAIKIHVGGVNVISGEPLMESAATRLRRLNALTIGESIQDYVITPEQLWLDGIASAEGRVRQFVAMEMGTGYTVEAQITGEDVTGGLQFEITPAKFLRKPLPESFKIAYDNAAVYPVKTLYIQTLTEKSFSLTKLNAATTIEEVKALIETKVGVDPDEQRLICAGKQLIADKYSLGEYNVPDQATIYLTLRLNGGLMNPTAKPNTEMGVAAGGLIEQCILPDTNPADIWQRDRTICFNVQILNSASFREVTGREPPETPISAATYADEGLPFFEIYKETSNIKGDFEGVKSVKAIDKQKNVDGKKRGRDGYEEDELSYKNPIVLLNPEGAKMGFRPVSELKRELSGMNAIRF